MPWKTIGKTANNTRKTIGKTIDWSRKTIGKTALVVFLVQKYKSS